MKFSGLTATRAFSGRWLALPVYLIVLVGLIGAAFAMISNFLDAYAALDKSRALLARLDRQTERTSPRPDQTTAAVIGPPFLTGKTIAIAGAALQERVEGAVKSAGGVVLSSQIELQGPRSAEGFVGLTESLEINQSGLQQLIYDLEAGMPYLFVDNLAIQAPQAFGEAEGTPMRVLVGVSGQWREPQ